MYDRTDPDERARVEKVVYDMVDRGLDMEGSCTVRRSFRKSMNIH
jgi:D-lactate dehydrogenase (cytochrome)